MSADNSEHYMAQQYSYYNSGRFNFRTRRWCTVRQLLRFYCCKQIKLIPHVFSHWNKRRKTLDKEKGRMNEIKTEFKKTQKSLLCVRRMQSKFAEPNFVERAKWIRRIRSCDFSKNPELHQALQRRCAGVATDRCLSHEKCIDHPRVKFGFMRVNTLWRGFKRLPAMARWITAVLPEVR